MISSSSSTASAPGLPGTPAVGSIIADKYLVDGLLGSGGMGVVVSAVHQQLGTRVAIKVLHQTAATDAPMMLRLLREAQSTAAVDNEHVVRVLDVSTLPSGQPFIVMEQLAGQNVADLLAAKGVLEPAEAVDLVLQACEGLAHAHARNIIHRDIKTSNLFMARRPDGESVLKILDFGISKAEWLSQGTGLVTEAWEVMGTPAYMSPEQARSSKAVDARTDIWSLGVVLYELVCGRLPFWAETASAMIAAVAADPPQDPRALRPTLPSSLTRVILSCLEKDPLRRPDSVARLAGMLAPLATQKGMACVDRITRLAAMEGSTLPRLRVPAPTGMPGASNRWPGAIVLSACVGLAAALAVVGGLMYARLHTRPGAAPDASASASAGPAAAAPSASGPEPSTSLSAPAVSPIPSLPAPPLPRSTASVRQPGRSAPPSVYDERF